MAKGRAGPRLHPKGAGHYSRRANRALDARAENETFTRFAELASGRMVVLISHRFSTVRMAERIIVHGDSRLKR
jgi:ABC-type multidrug transport system fused ATPase/permease subunit